MLHLKLSFTQCNYTVTNEGFKSRLYHWIQRHILLRWQNRSFNQRNAFWRVCFSTNFTFQGGTVCYEVPNFMTIKTFMVLASLCTKHFLRYYCGILRTTNSIREITLCGWKHYSVRKYELIRKKLQERTLSARLIKPWFSLPNNF